MNGDKLGQETPSARELTREIEQQTNLAIEAQDEQERGAEKHRQAVNLGNKILTYNPEQVAGKEQRLETKNEQVQELVEDEDREREAEADKDGQSDLLMQEREAWNQENLLNELDPKRDHEAKVMAGDQMGIGREMANMVEKATRGNNFDILALEIMRSKGRDWMGENFENPRHLGDMN